MQSLSSVVPTSGVHVGLFPVISQRPSCLRFLYCQWPFFYSRFISVCYWAITISPSLLFHFYSLVHCSSLTISLLFWLYLPSIPHTLVFILSPDPTPVCVQRRSTKIFLPSYCFCFVFIYQLHGLLSFIISFSRFGHIDGFLCFSPLAGTTLLHLSQPSLFFLWNPYWGSGFYFGFLTLEDGPICCPETLVRNCHYSLYSNRETRGSQNSYYKAVLVKCPWFNAILPGQVT